MERSEAPSQTRDIKGKEFSINLEERQARIFQHEYDHLEGTLYFDRMTPEVLTQFGQSLRGLRSCMRSEPAFILPRGFARGGGWQSYPGQVNGRLIESAQTMQFVMYYLIIRMPKNGYPSLSAHLSSLTCHIRGSVLLVFWKLKKFSSRHCSAYVYRMRALCAH